MCLFFHHFVNVLVVIFDFVRGCHCWTYDSHHESTDMPQMSLLSLSESVSLASSCLLYQLSVTEKRFTFLTPCCVIWANQYLWSELPLQHSYRVQSHLVKRFVLQICETNLYKISQFCVLCYCAQYICERALMSLCNHIRCYSLRGETTKSTISRCLLHMSHSQCAMGIVKLLATITGTHCCVWP